MGSVSTTCPKLPYPVAVIVTVSSPPGGAHDWEKRLVALCSAAATGLV